MMRSEVQVIISWFQMVEQFSHVLTLQTRISQMMGGVTK